MDIITRRVQQSDGKYVNTEFTIYDRSEAIEAGITFKEDWRDCRVGDWGLTDDGYVVICRGFKEITATAKTKSGKRKRKPHLKRRFYKFGVGEPIVGLNLNTGNIEKPKFEYLPFKEKGGYSHPRGKSWDESEKGKTRAKNAMALWVDAHISTEGKITWEQKVQAAALYRPNDKWPVLTFEKFLRSKGGQELFMSTLKEALDERKITYENALGKMEETYEQAREHNHTQVMRGVYKDQLDLIKEASGAQIVNSDDDGFDFSLLEAQMDEVFAPSRKLEEGDYEVIENGVV